MQEQALRVLQVICAVLSLGMLLFALAVAGMQLAGQGNSDAPLFRILGPLTAFVWVSSFFIQQTVATAHIRQAQRDRASGALDDSRLAARFSSTTIVRYALLDAGGLLGIVTTFLTGQWVTMAAPAATLLVMAMIFPSRGKLDDFVAAARRG